MTWIVFYFHKYSSVLYFCVPLFDAFLLQKAQAERQAQTPKKAQEAFKVLFQLTLLVDYHYICKENSRTNMSTSAPK